MTSKAYPYELSVPRYGLLIFRRLVQTLTEMWRN